MNQKRKVRIRRNQRGMSLIALVVTISLLGVVGFIMSSLMISQQETSPRFLDSTRAFHLAQGGINFAGKYLQGQSDWGSVTGTLNRSLGSGSFRIDWGAYNPGTKRKTVTSTGLSGSSQKQIIAVYQQSGTSTPWTITLYDWQG